MARHEVNGALLRSSRRDIPTELMRSVRLARTYRQQGCYSKASKVLVELIRPTLSSEAMVEVYLEQAEIDLDQGHFEEALGLWDKAAACMSPSPFGPRLLYLHSKILLEQFLEAESRTTNNLLLDQITSELEHTATLVPSSEMLPGILLGLGKVHHYMDEVDAAAEYLNRALTLESTDRQISADCYKELARIEHWTRENHLKAISLYQSALRTSPLRSPSQWLADTYCDLTITLLCVNDLEEALAMGQKALKAVDLGHTKSRETLFYVHNALGLAYEWSFKKTDQAVYHYQQALNLKRDAGIYYRLGGVYRAKGDLAQAVKMYEAIWEVEPNYANPGDAHNETAVCLAGLGRYVEALAHLQRARDEQASITFEPYEIYNNLGICYWFLGEYEQAAEAFKAALNLLRRQDEARRRIEWFLGQTRAHIPPHGTLPKV